MVSVRIQVAALTAATLVIGFAVASVSGSRALGGVVLLVGAAGCSWLMNMLAGAKPTVVAVGCVVVLFVLSHLLGRIIGAWPAVLLAAAAAGWVAFALSASPVAAADPH